MPVVKVENGYFCIELDKHPNIDLHLVYTPLYFQTVQLTSEIEIRSNKMVGGVSKHKELTFPYKYFVYMVEKNPISTAVKWIDLRGMFDNTLAKRSIDKEREDREKMIEKEHKEKEHKEKEESGFFPNIMDWFKPKHDPDTKDVVDTSPTKETIDETVLTPLSVNGPEAKVSIPAQSTVTQVSNTPIDHQDKMIIKIKMIDDVPHNGQPLNQILDTYKRSDRTIETFPESGLSYLFIDKIAYDIDNQQNHIAHIYDLHYSEFRDEFIYNINGHYVVFDSEKLVKKHKNVNDLRMLIGDFVRNLISGGANILEKNVIPEIVNTRISKDFLL